MLKLINIKKDYVAGDSKVEALQGISVEFRKCEFVSVLGPSGCGKTTLLNIIGGLDRYTSGDLVIDGVSTKEYRSVDWDIYRNNSIGFVFQSYNLIPHQSVLSNVELAMTLSGVGRKARRERAAEVLRRVGLGDQIHKKPNQLSGGQMQRVAIARALVNNPEILLADEPTGALDTETSTQIMELLKEIASDRLVIMVTHNPELADRYSTRIIRLLDGRITDDTDPYKDADEATDTEKKKKKRKKISMSPLTAISLSLNNLMTKKARTFLTAFAGSIGIIGIALIMSLSNGVQTYISGVERDVLSSYPITIEKQSVDMTSMFMAMMGDSKKAEHGNGMVYSNNVMLTTLDAVTGGVFQNDLTSFKSWLESDAGAGLAANTSAIQYTYDVSLQIYSCDADGTPFAINPSPIVNKMYGMTGTDDNSDMSTRLGIWQEMFDNEELIRSQYSIVDGHWPESWNEVVLVVSDNNEITDVALYSLGLMDQKELDDNLTRLYSGEAVEIDNEMQSYSYDDILSLRYKLLLPTDLYENENGIWVDRSGDNNYILSKYADAPEIKVVGIIKPADNTVAETITGSVAYTSGLSDYIIEHVNSSEIVSAQQSNPDVNVLTGNAFPAQNEDDKGNSGTAFTDEQLAQLAALSEEERAAYIASLSDAGSYDNNMKSFGVVDTASPNAVNLFPRDFEAKDAIADLIEEYNNEMTESGKEGSVLAYNDYIGLLLSSVTTIVNIVSYVLIAFVSISLVVSSIMIGIITYISVLERTKEIGILRSIGASKRDISRVFNAETLIVGLTAGLIGIFTTMLLNIPVNMLISSFADVGNLASLPVAGAVILVAISMLLTLVAGLIPSRLAAKKDPVVALRTE